MDIWEKMYRMAKEQYHPEDVSPFVYAHHVACALESENGEIYTGFCIESCSGVMNLCAERVAALNMYVNGGQTVVKRMIAFRNRAPYGDGSGMPCGACREFFMQLSLKIHSAFGKYVPWLHPHFSEDSPATPFLSPGRKQKSPPHLQRKCRKNHYRPTYNPGAFPMPDINHVFVCCS